MHRALECQQRPSGTLSLQGLNLTLSTTGATQRCLPGKKDPSYFRAMALGPTWRAAWKAAPVGVEDREEAVSLVQ